MPITLTPLSEYEARNLTLDALAYRPAGSIRLDDEQTTAYEDAGPVGDAMRRRLKNICIGLCARDGHHSIEIYAAEGYVLEIVRAN